MLVTGMTSGVFSSFLQDNVIPSSKSRKIKYFFMVGKALKEFLVKGLHYGRDIILVVHRLNCPAPDRYGVSYSILV